MVSAMHLCWLLFLLSKIPCRLYYCTEVSRSIYTLLSLCIYLVSCSRALVIPEFVLIRVQLTMGSGTI